eukprot:6205310-Pleurochrysis_carterae.AAC.3
MRQMNQNVLGVSARVKCTGQLQRIRDRFIFQDMNRSPHSSTRPSQSAFDHPDDVQRSIYALVGDRAG